MFKISLESVIFYHYLSYILICSQWTEMYICGMCKPPDLDFKRDCVLGYTNSSGEVMSYMKTSHRATLSLPVTTLIGFS
jgi:hypothetical protein